MDRNSLSKKGLVIMVILLFMGMSINPLTVALIDFTKVTEMNGNSPPSTPIFLGPTEGFVGVAYFYTINSTDPDGDEISYTVNWDDGVTQGSINLTSGTEIEWDHTWYEKGTYMLKAKARDRHGADSDWAILELQIYDTIYVDDDNTAGPWNGTIEYPYQYIQDGIDVADSIDTVFVFNGTYFENLLVDKSINLIGENKEFTIIDGSNADDVVYCRSDNIFISGFTIQNSGEYGIDKGIELYFCENTVLENNILSDNTYGIFLYYSNYNCLSYNLIIDNYYSGLSLSHADNNLIENNYFSNNDGGLRLYCSNNNSIFNNNLTSNKASGISIGTNCCYNLIFENRIKSQNLDGIKLSHSSNYNNVSGNEIIDNRMGINFYNSHNNTIFGNYLSNRMRGIDVTDSTHNIIKKNILENSQDGILLADASDNIITTNTIINNYRGISRISGGKDNIIFYNNFFENSNNGYEENIEHNQNWDNGEVGNYWDDYDGEDGDGDGIGDTPYNISGSESQDRYPLMEPYNDEGNTLYVGGSGSGNYTRIQDAIDNASNGYTVFVFDDSSPYYENLKINKSITLIGENRDTTIIDGNNMERVIVVDADNVNISRFTIQSSDALYGIVLHSDHNRISTNVIKNHHDAIFSMNSSHNDISNNIITGKYNGIELWGSHNKIIGNTISHIRGTGVSLHVTFNNSISGNAIKYCDMGIYISRSSSNIISRNIIQNNNVGIFLVLTTDTKVIQNDFIDNGISAAFAKSLIIEIWLKIEGIQGIEPEFLMFKPFVKNTWYNNYWGELYVYPYLIYGYRGNFLTSYGDFLHNVFNFLREHDSSIFNSVAVDWHPAREPYDI